MKIKSTIFCLLLAVAIDNFTTAKAQVDVNDSLALVDLYNNTNGPGWYHHNNWLTSAPVVTWQRVKVKDNRVVKLNLKANDLTGEIPSSMGSLSSLNYLDLSFNSITGIPPEIGNLSNLSYLDLSNIQLTNFPPEIGKLSNLIYLDLSNNQLTSLPPEIGNLSKLPVLYLSYNQLKSLPPEIGNLSSLAGLDLSNNQLTSLPPEIGYLSKLSGLYLYSNQLNSLPPEIGTLANLTNLLLYHNQLTGLPPEIGNLSNLTYLLVGNNQLTSLPPEIGNLANLYLLELLLNNLEFTSLEMIVQKLNYVPAFGYSPQANIPLHQNGNSLSVSAGGTLSNNTYNWYKVDEIGNTTIVGDSVFYPQEHGKYYAAVTNSICTQLTLYTDTVDYVGVLPVTLINLKAQQQGGMVKVEWTGLAEINVDHYEIQRCPDAQNFISIGRLPAKGNGTQRIDYFFNDLKPLQGNNYYRLKAFDKDGAITYSNMVLVKMNSDKVITLVYPNPVKIILNIQTNGSASFSLMNESGKIMITKAINNSGAIDVSHYAAGLYYLKNNITGEVSKIIITK